MAPGGSPRILKIDVSIWNYFPMCLKKLVKKEDGDVVYFNVIEIVAKKNIFFNHIGDCLINKFSFV